MVKKKNILYIFSQVIKLKLIKKLPKIKAHFIPIFFLLVPAALGFAVELYNFYFRGVHTPFVWISIILALLSLFFWIRRTWLYIVLLVFLSAYLFYYLQFIAADSFAPQNAVYYYRQAAFNTARGRLQLKEAIGAHPPQKGPYIVCYFQILNWTQYLGNQPRLCTGFDKQLRVSFTLNDQLAPEGIVRELQINDYSIERKSFLGEKLDRGSMQLNYLSPSEKIWRSFKLVSIDETYEREVQKKRFRVVESLTRDEKGIIKRITESPLEVYARPDQFAAYNQEGILKNVPRQQLKAFVFPKKLSLKAYNAKGLPTWIKPGEIP